MGRFCFDFFLNFDEFWLVAIVEAIGIMYLPFFLLLFQVLFFLSVISFVRNRNNPKLLAEGSVAIVYCGFAATAHSMAMPLPQAKKKLEGLKEFSRHTLS